MTHKRVYFISDSVLSWYLARMSFEKLQQKKIKLIHSIEGKISANKFPEMDLWWTRWAVEMVFFMLQKRERKKKIMKIIFNVFTCLLTFLLSISPLM